MRTILKRILFLSLSLVFAFGALVAGVIPTAEAAASMSVSAPSSVAVGDTVTVSINVNTGGVSANSFDATLSYNSGLFSGASGSFSGSVCTLPITTPNPSGGSATATCGAPAGLTGSGLVGTITLKAIAAGSGTFGLSGCQVLANDGHGTDITGGCSGRSITVTAAATPPPAATATPAAGSTTTKATPTPAKATPTPVVSQAPKAAETPKVETTPAPTVAPTAAPVQNLPKATATPAATAASSKDNAASTSQKRSVIQALRDVFSSFGQLGSMKKDTTGLAALMIGMIPVLSLTLAIVFFTYRLYLLERRRKRTLDRLFEMELGELASLEGKLDLLAEKGAKGREQYREEFQKAKENILRQLKPDFNKPVESDKEKGKPAAEPTKAAEAAPDAEKK
ncbi:MAG: cohesin domain-containing protein [bacterium]